MTARNDANWLERLLALAPRATVRYPDALADPGPITLVQYETELKLAPPERFLRWLIQNPEKMTWPEAKIGSPETKQRRSDLQGRPLSDQARLKQQEAMQEGLRELKRLGASGSRYKWWAFEGFTHVDCFIETEKLQIYVEGKRTEGLSRQTLWYPHRNQFFRNLESAQARANGKPFVCLMLVEEDGVEIPKSVIDASLPHLSEMERNELLDHFAGAITWKAACSAVGLDFACLPTTVPPAQSTRQMRHFR